MLNSPQVFRPKLDSSAYSPVHLLKVCMVKQSVLLLIFLVNKTLSPAIVYDNAIFASDYMFYQLLDDTYFFFIENKCGITLAFTFT